MSRDLLIERREARRTAARANHLRWTDDQRKVLAWSRHLLVWWGANGVGKSRTLAEYTRRGIAGLLPWQRQGPQTVILAGNTWKQLGVTLGYLWETVDPSWFRPGVRFESGGMKGQRMPVYDVVGGPGAGGQLWLGTFDAENLAGPRANLVVSDEPLPAKPFAELLPRLLGRDGRMVMGFTPTLGTSHKLDHIWRVVDDPACEWAGEIQTELTLNAVTPRGGIVDLPWMTQAEIDRMRDGLPAVEVEMRMGRTRTPRRNTAYFSAWSPNLVGPCNDIPPGTRLGIGIDHGSRPGAQRAMLVAVGGIGLFSRVWVIDEYQGDGRTESDEDGAGIVEMCRRNGYGIENIDLWVGDRAHGGDSRGGRKSNERLKRSIAKYLGHEVSRRGWSERLPKPLRYMQTPRKYDRSVWEGCEILHRLMVGSDPLLRVAPECVHLHQDLADWQGAKLDPHKDGIDALRYIVVPMVESTTR